MNLLFTILLVFSSVFWPTQWAACPPSDGMLICGTYPSDQGVNYAVSVADLDPCRTIDLYPVNRSISSVENSHLVVAIYAWDERAEGMRPVKLAADGGLDIKGGQTVYIKWLYEDDPQLIRVRDLEQRIEELEASNDALTTDVLRLVGKELRRKDDANKPWWEANDYWEAAHKAFCAWALEYRIDKPEWNEFTPAFSALRKACGEQ